MTDFADLFPGASRDVLHYPGDKVNSLLAQEAFGPDMYGARYKCVSATYDPTTNTTTGTFRPIPRPQKDPHAQRRVSSPAGPNRKQRRATRRGRRG